MFGLGFGELIIVLLVVLVFFGGSRLPKLGSSLGQAINNFKKGLNESEEQKKIDKKED
ncbi:MAG: twin-arginine translocase TatA/TatE family subunit [Proteobacteria bacterium]|jgi:sec-independent protein translocase protein TatA|nr:twin-arginine translocase TatA/TatE family subunit [Pseudomonadota bacterium]